MNSRSGEIGRILVLQDKNDTRMKGRHGNDFKLQGELRPVKAEQVKGRGDLSGPDYHKEELVSGE